MTGHHDNAEEVTRRNVEQARELLAAKHQQDEARADEPPAEEDPIHAEGNQNQLVKETTGVRGSTGGIRNMGGGRA